MSAHAFALTTRVQPQVDVSDLESVAAFAKSLASEFPRIDVLVNNAGINGIGSGPGTRTKQGIEKVCVALAIEHCSPCM